MLWWQQARDDDGHINEALSHINAARDTSTSSPSTRTCELYFHALNKRDAAPFGWIAPSMA